MQLELAVGSTAAAVDSWLGSRQRYGGPSDSVDALTSLHPSGPGDFMALCLYRVPPQPIPGPAEVETVADGMALLVDASGNSQVDSIGSFARLEGRAAQLTSARE